MKTNIKVTNTQMTPAIGDYINSKLIRHIEHLVGQDESAKAHVEVGKSTKHHQKGEVFVAEVNLHIAGADLRAVVEEIDLYAAIDAVKDEIADEITSYRDKKVTLFRRGARLAKDALRGFVNLPGRVGRSALRGIGKIKSFKFRR